MVPLGNGELVDAVWGFAMRSEGWLPDAVCCRTGGDKGVRGPFTGRNGGPIAKAAKFAFKAPEAATPRVQELHILAWHGICEIVEAALVAERAPGLAETGS